MCLFSAVYRTIPGCPVFVLANREEDPRRPAAPPRIVRRPEAASWLGGIDLKAGGTWLGVNEFGLLAAITNRPKRHVPADRRSRGLLCLDLLACENVEVALEVVNAQRAIHRFAGFNVVLFDRQQAAIAEAGNDFRVTRLRPGIHTLTNGVPDDPADERLQRARRELEAAVQRRADAASLADEAQRICSLDGRDGPAICLSGPQSHTVSSTVIALTDQPAKLQYRFAAGPPSTTPYRDFSCLLRQLLQPEKTEIVLAEGTNTQDAGHR